MAWSRLVLFVLFVCVASIDDDVLIERARHVRRLDVAGPRALSHFVSDSTAQRVGVAQLAGAAHVTVWRAAPLVVLLEGEWAEQELRRIVPRCEAAEARDVLRTAIGEMFVALAAPPSLLEQRPVAARYVVGFTIDSECQPQIVAVADSIDAGLPLSDPLKLALAAIDAGWHSLVPDEDAVCHLAEALLRIPEDLVAFPSAKYAGRRGLQPPHLCNPAPIPSRSPDASTAKASWTHDCTAALSHRSGRHAVACSRCINHDERHCGLRAASRILPKRSFGTPPQTDRSYAQRSTRMARTAAP